MLNVQNTSPNSTNPSSAITANLIFDTDNLNALILDTIYHGRLSNSLYELRAKKIKNIIGVNINSLCHKNEIKIIHEIIELSQQLPEHLKNKDIQKLHNTCEKILHLAYNYIYYRVNGIQQHLNTGNVDKFYGKDAKAPLVIFYSLNWGEIYITGTFKEHKAKRLKEIDAYSKKPEVISALKALYQLVPSLFYQQQSIDEFLRESKNPFNEQGIAFVEPPFVVEINKLVQLIGLIYKSNYTAETLTALKQITEKFTAKKDYDNILELLGKVYIPIECLAFWPQLNQSNQQVAHFFRVCLSIGTHLPAIIPYDLLDISEEKIKEANKTLERSTSTIEDKIEAGRTLLYSRIPWYLIRHMSGLFLKSTNSDGLEKTIIFEANQELGHAWQSLLPTLQDLITFEATVVTQQVNITANQYKPLDANQYILLQYLGNYAADVLFLHKITSTLSDLDFNKPFLVETYLRLLGILGECAKNLSPFSQKLIGKNYWDTLAKIRDKIAHTTGYLRRLQEVLEQKPELAEGIKAELQLLLTQALSAQQQLPSTWQNIKQFYAQDPDSIQPLPSNLGISLTNLLAAIDPVLTDDDYKELRATKQYIPKGLEEKRDHILKVINKEIEAKAVDQDVLFATIDALNALSTKQKSKIKEAYKKLRQGKDAKLPQAVIEDLQKIKSLTDSEIDSCIEVLIKNLKSYGKAETLEKELAKNGLADAKDIWEEKRQKYIIKAKNNSSKRKKPSNQSWDLDKILIESIDAAKNILKHLEILNKLVHSKNSTDMLPVEQFWANPILCHAVEFHFTRLRIYTDIIQDALRYLPRYDVVNETVLKLNSLYRALSIKLQNIRLYGNSLAHLHDVTEFDGRTTHGHRLTAYLELWNALKDYKSLNSIKTNLTTYISVLTETIESINKDRTAKLDDNRKTYQSVYKWQQQILAKLPNLNLSDYQILSTFSNIDDNDPGKKLKQQLYNATKELVRLHQEFLSLQNLSPITSATKRPSGTTKYANVAGQRLTFEETAVVGDGWCTLNAIGIADPAAAINLLKNQLNNPHIINYIRNTIENNYQASLALDEEFDIAGNDNDNNSIKDKIIALYLNCQNTDSAQQQQAYLAMLQYLERPEVQIAYLDYLLKTRYVDSNIAAACLNLQGKKLALFIDYNLPDGQLINSIEDNVSPSDPNTVCIVFHPNSRQSSAHYNLLNITTLASQNLPNAQQNSTKNYNYSQAELTDKFGTIFKSNKDSSSPTQTSQEQIKSSVSNITHNAHPVFSKNNENTTKQTAITTHKKDEEDKDRKSTNVEADQFVIDIEDQTIANLNEIIDRDFFNYFEDDFDDDDIEDEHGIKYKF